MKQFIPYKKLSKKEKRKLDQAKRQTWSELNPVTRKPENSKAYNRNKSRSWKYKIYAIQFRESVFKVILAFDCKDDVGNHDQRYERQSERIKPSHNTHEIEIIESYSR